MNEFNKPYYDLTWNYPDVLAAQAVSMEELLQQVKSGRVKDAAENEARIAEFQRDRALGPDPPPAKLCRIMQTGVGLDLAVGPRRFGYLSGSVNARLIVSWGFSRKSKIPSQSGRAN